MKSQIQHFNFQRDGILRKAEKIEPYAHFCFNSQRDGILLRYASGKRDEFAVSIPNGIDLPIPTPCFRRR